MHLPAHQLLSVTRHLGDLQCQLETLETDTADLLVSFENSK